MKPIVKSVWVNNWYISYSEWSKTRRSFIVITFQLFVRVRHYLGPGKSGGLKLNGTHQPPEILIYASKDAGVEVNREN
jgi:hypothetical protein